MEHMDTFYHHEIQITKNFITQNLDGYTNKKVIYWMLQEKASGTVIGDFSFWNMDHKHHRTEIGYTLHSDFWGKGYMKEAMLTLFSFGFKDLNIHSFEANTNPKNKNSKNILLKLGFKKEAYFRESFFYNGEYLDSEIFCLLEKDYESNNFT
jgi:ribosomal-protein-alanine N-acetyltransferase